MVAMSRALLVVLGGCALDMSGGQPWVPIDELHGPLVAEAGTTGTAFGRRAIPTNPLRIATYNLQYAPDPSALASALLEDPDLARAGVVLIQEVESHTDEGRSRAAELADQLGFGFVYVPAREIEGGTHGLAIMSAFPITDVQRMDLPQAGLKNQHRIAIQASIDVEGHEVHVVDLHLDTMLNTRQRIAQLSPIAVGAPAQALIAGDFNTCWVEWIGGKVPVLSSTRASDQAPVVDDYMRAQGFDTPTIDSGPTEHMFGLESRLDSIYTRGYSVTFGGVPRVGPSDHWPMWLDLELP